MVAVLFICGALIMAAFAIVKYEDLDDTISKIHGQDEKDTMYGNCADGTCKNNGKCVKIIQGGYYCICNSEKFYGRHCENGRKIHD